MNFYGSWFSFVYLLIKRLVMSLKLVNYSAPLEEFLHYGWAVWC